MCKSTLVRFLVGASVAGIGLSVAASSARAEQVKYVGGHPIPGGGFCHIEAAHVHVYKPHKEKKKVDVMYRVHDGHHHFVGDPVGHGYDGPKHAYYGHHPIAVDVAYGAPARGAPHHIEYCYLDGPHYHWYAPPADLEFTVKGDAYWYVGTYPPAYGKRKKAMMEINAIYHPITYARPVIEVEPPAAYVGPVLEVHAPVVEVGGPVVEVEAAHGHVRGPMVHGEIRAGVEVHVPAPRLEVGVAVPGVVVVEEHHHDHRVKVRKHKYKSKSKVKVRSHKKRKKGRYRP